MCKSSYYLGTVFLIINLLSCALQTVSTSVPSTGQVQELKEKFRVVVLIRSKICSKIEEINKTAPSPQVGTKTKCLKYDYDGWYPVEFTNLYMMDFSAYYPRRHLFEIFKLPKKLISQFEKNKHPQMEYIPVRTLEELKDPKVKNWIVLRLNSYNRELHWSSILPLVSLLIIPGKFSFLWESEVTITQGKEQLKYSGKDISKLNLWVGWLFFLWGSLSSANSNDLILSILENSLIKFLNDSNKSQLKTEAMHPHPKISGFFYTLPSISRR